MDSLPTFVTRIEHYQSCANTMELLQRRAEAGEPEGLVIWADESPYAQGRYGRPWHAPLGGLWLSILLRPVLAPSRTGLWNLAAPWLVLQCVRELAPSAEVGIKWPNDVVEVSSGRKLAGVLIWARGDAERWDYLLWGIGWNISNPIDPERAPRGISMTSLGYEGSVEQALWTFLKRLEDWYQRFREGKFLLKELEETVRRYCVTLGQKVKIELPDGKELFAHAEDIDREGHLVVRTEAGEVKVISAGECHHLR